MHDSNKRPPRELQDYWLMKMYGCTPNEFDEQPAYIVRLHSIFAQFDHDKRDLDRKRAAQKNKK